MDNEACVLENHTQRARCEKKRAACADENEDCINRKKDCVNIEVTFWQNNGMIIKVISDSR